MNNEKQYPKGHFIGIGLAIGIPIGIPIILQVLIGISGGTYFWFNYPKEKNN